MTHGGKYLFGNCVNDSVEVIDREKNVAQGLGALAIQNLINGSLAFVFLAASVRLLTPTDYGAYSSVVIVVGIASMVSVFGLSYAAARYFALYGQDIEDNEKSWSAARATFNLGLIFSIIAASVFTAFSPYLSLYFTRSLQWTDLFILGSLWLFTNSIGLVAQGIAQGMRKYIPLAKILTIAKIVMTAFALMGLEFYHNAIIGIASWIIFNVVIIVACLKLFGSQLFHRRIASKQYTSILRYSIPLGIASILTILSTNADLVIVGGYLNLVSLAIYNLAVQISLVLTLVAITPLITALLPETAFGINRNKVTNGLRLAMRFLVLVLLPMSFLVAALSSQLLTLFSNGGIYLQGIASLQLISTTYIFVGIQLIIFTLLQATGRTFQALSIASVSAFTDVMSSIILIPSYGLIGAALTKVLVGFLGMLIAFYYVRADLKQLDPRSFYLKGIICSAIPFIVVLSLSLFVSSRTISIFPYTIVGTILFIGCVKATKILTAQDKVFISHLLPQIFQKILRYL